MKSKFLWLVMLVFIAVSCSRFTQKKFDAVREEAAIRSVLNAEQIAWNNGDMEAFMDNYWKSDSLQFMSLRGVNHGWQAVFDAYKKGYPDRAAMGTLSLEINQMTPLPPSYFLVTGHYKVTQTSSIIEGEFTLIFRKINGRWLAIHDHHN